MDSIGPDERAESCDVREVCEVVMLTGNGDTRDSPATTSDTRFVPSAPDRRARIASEFSSEAGLPGRE